MELIEEHFWATTDNITLVNLDRDLRVYLFISMKYNLLYHHYYGNDVVNTSIVVVLASSYCSVRCHCLHRHVIASVVNILCCIQQR